MRTFGLPRFDRAQPFFPSPSSSPSFLDIGPQCTPNLLISEPRIVTENYIGSMLILPWTPLETVDAWFDSTIFSITFRLQPLMGLFNLQRKATKTDVPELLHSQFVAVPFKKMQMILLKINTEEMVPRVSRSVHARLTVIVGLLPVIVRLLGVGRAQSTLVILGSWQFIYDAFVVVPALDSQWWNSVGYSRISKQQMNYFGSEGKIGKYLLSWYLYKSFPAGLSGKYARM